jgi:hypothetical protein
MHACRKDTSPDYNDPDFLDRQERLAAALAGRFNGHPDLAHIDIGHIGNSGEWHTDTCPRVDGQGRVPMANTETARRVIDWYVKYWNKTPKVMPYHHVTPPEFVEYAVRQGAGWRYNGWGAKIGRYAEKLRLAHAEDAWKRGPVALEPVGADGWAKEDHATAFKAALALHVSCAHGYMVPIPDEKVPLLNDFLRRCGYRFVLRELRAPRRVVRGGNLPVQMAFENIGVAPPYRAYVLAVRLTSGGKSFVLNTDAKLTSWLPGKHGLEARLSLPVDIPAGNYELAVGILAPHNRTPAVKLAIEGRGDDGWYPLSHVEVRT